MFFFHRCKSRILSINIERQPSEVRGGQNQETELTLVIALFGNLNSSVVITREPMPMYCKGTKSLICSRVDLLKLSIASPFIFT